MGADAVWDRLSLLRDRENSGDDDGLVPVALAEDDKTLS